VGSTIGVLVGGKGVGVRVGMKTRRVAVGVGVRVGVMVGVGVGVGVAIGSPVGVAVGVSEVADGITGVTVGVADGGAPQYSRISGSAPGAAMISEQASTGTVSLSIMQVAWPSSTRSRVAAELSATLKRAGTSLTLTRQDGATNWYAGSRAKNRRLPSCSAISKRDASSVGPTATVAPGASSSTLPSAAHRRPPSAPPAATSAPASPRTICSSTGSHSELPAFWSCD
jgi:hypothetical protein